MKRIHLPLSFRALGVDIGGTYVKTGIVNSRGEILYKKSIKTSDLLSAKNFIETFAGSISRIANDNRINQIGVGVPGMMSADMKEVLYIPAIPALTKYPLYHILKAAMPGCCISLENDANAAALGACYFSEEISEETFALITMGTGIGSAAIIKGELFKGGNGIALKLGEVIVRKDQILENLTGHIGIVSMAEAKLREYGGSTILKAGFITMPALTDAAKHHDGFAEDILFRVGEILGEALVSMIRILDITTIYIGGGMSSCFNYIRPGIISVLLKNLSSYYLDQLKIAKATLGNDLGVIGAAVLTTRKAHSDNQ